MKKFFIMFLIVITIILAFSISVYAEYDLPDTMPTNTYNYPYIVYVFYDFENVGPPRYSVIYTSVPHYIIYEDEWFGEPCYMIRWKNVGYELWEYIIDEGGTWEGISGTHPNWGYPATDIIYMNYASGLAEITLEVEENQNSFFGIDFDYSWFLGDLKLQIGKKQEGGTYKVIKEWKYPKGSGHVSIPADEIPQGNKGEYMIIIYEGDTIIREYPYKLNVEKESYCEINYPVNGQSYNYKPNVNIRYFDMGRLYIYINGEMYKQIQTKDREGIEVIDGKNDLFDVGMNTVSVKDSNGQVVATVQYEVMREGLDGDYELPEFEAESWVKELFNKIMNEYSMFFEYVKSMYAFLPVEIIGLVGIIMMLSVILWFTGRR
jgi:hypothetical protein